jgi:hypothetical protein
MRRPLDTTSGRPAPRSESAIDLAYVGSAAASPGWGACIAAMYWMAWSCTSIGIVMRTVGLDVGTGRVGMSRPASGGAALVVEDAAVDGGVGGATVPASRSASGPLLSHAKTPTTAMSNRRGPMGRF